MRLWEAKFEVEYGPKTDIADGEVIVRIVAGDEAIQAGEAAIKYLKTHGFRDVDGTPEKPLKSRLMAIREVTVINGLFIEGKLKVGSLPDLQG